MPKCIKKSISEIATAGRLCNSLPKNDSEDYTEMLQWEPDPYTTAHPMIFVKNPFTKFKEGKFMKSDINY